MEIDKEDWVEIKQGEYRRIKKSDPKNCNSYTCRICHKYYKKKWNLLSKIDYDYKYSGHYFFTDVEELLIRLIIEVEKIHLSNMTWTPAMQKIINTINSLYGKKLDEEDSWEYNRIKKEVSSKT
jgi:hypothetical protein